MKGLIDMVTYLKQQEVQLAIASGSSLEQIKVVIHNFGIADVFDVLISADSVKQGKPVPDIYLACADTLQVLPEACVVFEDTQRGVESAVRAGMYVVAIPSRFTQEHDLSRANMKAFSLADGNIKELFV